MLETVRMARWEAVVFERDLRGVLHVLGALGAVQFVPAAPGPDTAPGSPPEVHEALGRCCRLRALAAELRRALPAPSVPRHPRGSPPCAASGSGLPSAWSDVPATLADLERKTRQWQQRRESLRRQLRAERSIAERAAAFSGTELPLPELVGLQHLACFSGSVPDTAWDRLARAARAHGFLVRLGSRGGRVHCFAVTTPARRLPFEDELRRAEFHPEPLPQGGAPTPEAELQRSTRELQGMEEQERRADLEGTQLAHHARGVADRVEAFVEDEERILRASGGFPRTRTSVLLTGWVPAGDAARATDAVRRATDGRCLVTISPGIDTAASPVPVAIRPPGWLRPFARLVEPYGLPRYEEADPTLFVAVGYLAMFGMMFGDVGHGVLLALVGLALHTLRSSPAGRDFGLVLGWGGLASAGFGLVYGSCFGLPAFRAHALWRDPLEGDAMGLIRGALAVGVGTLGLGMGLNVLNRWRAKDWSGLWLGHFGVAGAVFYATGVLWALQTTGQAGGSLPAWAGGLGLVLPLVAWCLRDPVERLWFGPTVTTVREGGLGGAVVESVVGAFEATLLFLANTVSFVRLAAYALSHAAILAAAFAMAEQVRPIPRLGAVLALLLIVAGNFVAMVLEGLVASVQALRLQYYEFLGKFFTGEGTPFTPFRLSVPPPLLEPSGAVGAGLMGLRGAPPTTTFPDSG